jgi:hypothetical protein
LDTASDSQETRVGLALPSLFAEEELAPKRYVPNPQHVRNSLKDLLGQMRAAERWPWEGAVLSLYRDLVPPQLYAELPDAEEAARWRADIEAEAARLDAAA